MFEFCVGPHLWRKIVHKLMLQIPELVILLQKLKYVKVMLQYWDVENCRWCNAIWDSYIHLAKIKQSFVGGCCFIELYEPFGLGFATLN